MPVALESIVPSSGDATDHFLVRRGAGPLGHTVELLTPASVKALLSISAADVSGLAAVATSGSASDLGAGTLPAARFDDTSHGNRGGGALHASVVAAGAAGFMTGADKTKLDGIASGAQVNVPTDLAYTAATRLLASSTGADVTLPLATTTDAGLAPARSGVATEFLNGAGAYSTPGGGGGGSGDVVGPASATDNALARFDTTTGKLIQNATVTLDDAGAFTIPAIATPTVPASGGLKFFATSRAGQPWPAFRSPASGEAHPLQPLIANGNYVLFMPAVGTTVTNLGMSPATAGTATGLNVAAGSRLNRMKRLAYRITTAAATAVASWRNNAAQLTIGGGNAWEGGFWGVMHGGPDTGCTNASHRFFMGLGDTAAPTDVNPSTLLRIAGIGYDAADTQVQFMHNDGSGVATKIALGASFPKPNADSSFAYRLRLYSPPGSTQSLSYEVENLGNGAVASGTVTTNLPVNTDFITPKLYASVGGVSSVVGVMLGPIMFQTED